ncbi:MAG TPA: histidine phosphatase family protein [Dehalococcoidia bacterium]|nr:histidine phosphatase family protein [Dehalococcoidia bacterium]
MNRLILVRHGESAWNKERRYQGQQDVPLSPLGWLQAERLRERLAGERIDAVYASDLVRAVETAETIVQGRCLTIEKCPELREAYFGEWEGLTFEEVAARDGEKLNRLLAEPHLVAPASGEGLPELQRRVCSWVEPIVRQQRGSVLVVSHYGPLKSLLCHFLGLDLGSYFRIRMDNASVSIVDIYPQGPVVSLLNDTHHLRECDGYQS